MFLTSLCPFGCTSRWLTVNSLMPLRVCYILWTMTTLWLMWCGLWWVGVTGEGVCPLRPATLLLHFNQQQKKAIFWLVCQRCPAAMPTQPEPTLSPIWCNCQIKTLQIRRRNDVHSHSLLHVPTTHLLSSIPFPCLLFISLSNFSEVRSRKPCLWLISLSWFLFEFLVLFCWMF